jgi:hypothetical protein
MKTEFRLILVVLYKQLLNIHFKKKKEVSLKSPWKHRATAGMQATRVFVLSARYHITCAL